MNRIEELRKVRGLTLEQLGDAAGTTRGTIHKLQTGQRQLTQEWMERLAGPLGVEPWEVAFYSSSKPSGIDLVSVIGEASAGNWLEIDELTGESLGQIPVVAIGKYSNLEQYGLKIRGNSINLKSPDGSYAICVRHADTGEEPKHGKFYHVEQIREDGGLHEVTIKKLKITKGVGELWPESDDPRYQEPIDLGNLKEGVVVQFIGRVIGWYDPEEDDD